MILLMSIVIHTANILGIFTDPFEFDGDYGAEVNPTREQVFERVVSKGPAAFEEEKAYGPTLSEVITPELIAEIKSLQEDLKESGFNDDDFEALLTFIDQYKDQKLFYFLRNNPPELLNLDKTLRDKAAREGKSFDLPILGSTAPLQGSTSHSLKANLIHAVFKADTFALTKPQEKIKQALDNLPLDYLKTFLGETANNRDLTAFSTPLGQVFFYWMYQALNLELIAADPALIPSINHVKAHFAQTLGDPVARATTFKDKLIAADSTLLFTQESDALVPQLLIESALFHPLKGQNTQDGTFVLLRSDIWEPNYTVIPLESYEGFHTGKINLIIATRKETQERFMLASCHGHSTRAEDGRLQIALIMEKFHALNDGHLQLLIGIDANTKTEEDVHLFKAHLDTLGLIATETGPTTIKKRMVTAQHAKAGKLAIDEEDYLITLKPDHGGHYTFTHVTVGFTEEKADITEALPNLHNPSDHYPVGAYLAPEMNFLIKP